MIINSTVLIKIEHILIAFNKAFCRWTEVTKFNIEIVSKDPLKSMLKDINVLSIHLIKPPFKVSTQHLLFKHVVFINFAIAGTRVVAWFFPPSIMFVWIFKLKVLIDSWILPIVMLFRRYLFIICSVTLTIEVCFLRHLTITCYWRV